MKVFIETEKNPNLHVLCKKKCTLKGLVPLLLFSILNPITGGSLWKNFGPFIFTELL